MTSTDRDGDVELRPAADDDADAVTDVLLRARAAAVLAGTMPRSVHPPADVVRHVREHLLVSREVWVAQLPGDDVVGVMALDDRWLDDLYVVPEQAGRGIGSALLDCARALRPDGFDLWVFEVNTSAQRFYERHGMVELERTEGAGNEEHAPDRRYGWRPEDSTGSSR